MHAERGARSAPTVGLVGLGILTLASVRSITRR